MDIQIGTPKLNFTVLIDTGSNQLWIPISNCTNCGNNTFNLAASSTSVITTASDVINYADGSGVSGYYGSDVFSIPNTTIDLPVSFLWIDNATGMGNNPFDGIIGLSFDKYNLNAFDNAYQNGSINSNIFAIQLQPNTT